MPKNTEGIKQFFDGYRKKEREREKLAGKIAVGCLAVLKILVKHDIMDDEIATLLPQGRYTKNEIELIFNELVLGELVLRLVRSETNELGWSLNVACVCEKL